MPDPPSRAARALALGLLGLMCLAAAAPAASALELSSKAIKVAGSSEYNPETVQIYAGEVEGGPPAFDGQGTTIAVIDTGVDDEHPTFEGAWVAGAELQAVCDEDGCFQEEDSMTGEPWNPDDTHGHGTHVASIALGRGASSSTPEGESVPRGIAPGARLVEVKVGSSPTAISLSDIARGIRWVLDYNAGQTRYGPDPHHPVEVILVSLGATTPKDGENAKERDEAMQAIKEAWEAGVLTVVGAGNCGPGHDDDPSTTQGCDITVTERGRNTITSPGAAPEALTVGAIDDHDTVTRNQDSLAGYSSRGPNPAESNTETFWRKPDVVAPGSRIEAACHAGLPGDQTGRRDQLCTRSGTSAAAPHVAGLAAILFQAGRVADSGDGFTARQVKGLVTATASDWSSPGWDPATGYGYVDGYAALVAAVNRPPLARFQISPMAATAGEEVTLDASLTTDPDDQDLVTRFLWEFGDGTDPLEVLGETKVVHHTYEDPGSYTVRLTAFDSRGGSGQLVQTVNVRQPPPPDLGEHPTPVVKWWPQVPRAGEEVTFDASNSTDPDGDKIARYEWDFAYRAGDFRADERTSEPTITWTYDLEGTHRIALRVVDEHGLAAIASKPIRVLPPPPGPPELIFTNPQEGDRVQVGPVLASWIVKTNPAHTFTLYVDGREDVTLNARQVRIDLSRGEHTLRVVGLGPGGSASAWVNVTAVTEEDLRAAAASSSSNPCTVHTHADGSREEHCEVQRVCETVVNGDGTTERKCRTVRIGQAADDPPATQDASNDTPWPPSLPLLVALVVALATRRRDT